MSRPMLPAAKPPGDPFRDASFSFEVVLLALSQPCWRCPSPSEVGRAHVDLGAEAQSRGPAIGIQVETDPLALAQHPKHRTVESIARQIHVGEIGLVHQHAVAAGRIEALDHALHPGERNRRGVPAALPSLTVPSAANSIVSPGVPASIVDAALLRQIIMVFSQTLQQHRTAINNLNVYPVPDGDTGTNMSLTMQSVVAEFPAIDNPAAETAETDAPAGSDEPDPQRSADLEAVCGAISHGSLMGARGNSGVILSQILREFAGVLLTERPADSTVVASALTAASAGAYSAVMKPVEGTILTVIREASEAAQAATTQGRSLIEVLEAARDQGYDALARTPEMLAVLAEAGVVDAGGSGLLLLFDAALHALDGRPLPEPAPVTASDFVAAAAGVAGPASSGEPAIADLRYEVMFFLDAEDDSIAGFKETWAGIGDCIVVVGGDGVWNCHVHSDDIGAAIEAGIAVGRPRDIRVTDLLDEVEEQDWVRAAMGEPPTEPVPCAVVAVAAGAGLEAIFRSLGVHRIVTGGQSMNPSTADLLTAVAAVPSTEVVLLPNNKNIIPVAEQVVAVSDRTVRVVPTRSVAEGIGCLMAFDPEAAAQANATRMAAAAQTVVSGEVTQAVRDATSTAGSVREGDWLGIAPDGICAVESSAIEAATALLATIMDDDHELLTVIAGEGADDATTAAIEEYARSRAPDLEVEVQTGDQPLYPYYFGLE